tara:strand:- start:2210 stop:2350 length:141 start_codon:yes stop_codon:yes gene_type:complete
VLRGGSFGAVPVLVKDRYGDNAGPTTHQFMLEEVEKKRRKRERVAA